VYSDTRATPAHAVIQFIALDGTGAGAPGPDTWFVIDDVEFSVQSGIEDGHSLVPDNVHLYNNYPNPFNPKTTIEYQLAKPSHVRVTIYNQLGRVVTTLVNEPQGAGRKSIIWDGRDSDGQTVGSGVYFYQVEADDVIASRRMVLLK